MRAPDPKSSQLDRLEDVARQLGADGSDDALDGAMDKLDLRARPRDEGEPLFSERLREWVLPGVKGGRRLNQIKSRLEKKTSSDLTTFRGDVLHLELDRTTNRLTVSVVIAPEIEPEVVDYDEFKTFALRDRP